MPPLRDEAQTTITRKLHDEMMARSEWHRQVNRSGIKHTIWQGSTLEGPGDGFLSCLLQRGLSFLMFGGPRLQYVTITMAYSIVGQESSLQAFNQARLNFGSCERCCCAVHGVPAKEAENGSTQLQGGLNRRTAARVRRFEYGGKIWRFEYELRTCIRKKIQSRCGSRSGSCG